MTETSTVRMHVVVECPMRDRLPPWPVAEREEFGMLRLSGAASPEEVGLVVAQLALANAVPVEGSPADVLRGILADDELLLPGGIRVADASGNEVRPGCCCGVEHWREWMRADQPAMSPWMGHTPYGWVEHDGEMLRVCSRPEPPPNDTRPEAENLVLVPRAELAPLLSGVRGDLRAFAARLREWAIRLDPELGPALADRFDTRFVQG